MKIYNTFSRKKEIFKPLHAKIVNLFVCGPTVYDFPHIGHARTYVVFDAFVKFLKEMGFKVFYLQNITDIDDKIINRAREKNVSWTAISEEFEKEYLLTMKKLGINSVSKYARATDHIKEMLNQIKELMKIGFAYKVSDGIYFDISKFKKYGKLSGRTALQAQDAVSRIDENENKKNKGDFCLWKFWSEDEKEPKWESEWGSGRPGWHIEDTAIAQKHFGFQYDLHGGGKDLIFPHHEAEIAQMEAISKKSPMVKYWMHTGFLSINGKKMSKSLGNFISVGEFLQQNSPRVLRYVILKSHYRSPLNYTKNTIPNAKKDLKRIEEFLDKIQKIRCKSQNGKEKFKIDKFRKEFKKALNDDFNTPKAIASIFSMIKRVNPLIDQNAVSQKSQKEILKFLKDIDKFLGFIFEEKKETIFNQKVKNLVQKREEYRKQKQWELADKIRKEVEVLGFKIEDTKTGPKIKKI